MNFMLDKTTYNLLSKISKSYEYQFIVFDENLQYLEYFQFITHTFTKNIHRCTILPKGRVALRNYEENEKLLKFNKYISIATLIIAAFTLVVAIVALFFTIKQTFNV